MSVASPDLATLRQLTEQIRPLALAAERLLPVPEVLATLIPQGGMVRGSTVATTGSAATSLALALAGPTTVAGSWCAVVGMAHLGLLAAAELGVALERTLLIADPEPTEWASVVAALLDAVDVVLVQPSRAITPSVQRRLLARARDRGSVLLQAGGAPGRWAAEPDLVVGSGASRWEGLGVGHGRLRARRVEVEVRGRRASGRHRSATIWLPGPDGQVALAEPLATRSATNSSSSASPAAPVAPVAEALREAG